MSQPNAREVITTQALKVWVAAKAVYLVAITGRSSFGVAGLDAIERFDVNARRIAAFASVQLGVYAIAVADSPEKLGVIPLDKEPPNSPSSSIGTQLRAVFTSPIAWQAYFIHCSGMLPLVVFVMRWGMPMMTQGMELSKGEASLVLTLLAVFLVLIGPLARADFLPCTEYTALGRTRVREPARADLGAILRRRNQWGSCGHYRSLHYPRAVRTDLKLWFRHHPREHGPRCRRHRNRRGMAGVVITHILRRRGGYAGPSVRIVEVT